MCLTMNYDNNTFMKDSTQYHEVLFDIDSSQIYTIMIVCATVSNRNKFIQY